MRFFNRVCFCFSLDKGCIWIAVIGIGLSGIVLLIQTDAKSIIGFVLSVISSFSLLIGTIKILKAGVIIYLVIEMAQIIGLLIFSILTIVQLLNKTFSCHCDSHECKDDEKVMSEFCKMIGTSLVSLGGADVLVSIYFWLCVLSLFRKMTSEEKLISIF